MQAGAIPGASSIFLYIDEKYHFLDIVPYNNKEEELSCISKKVRLDFVF